MYLSSRVKGIPDSITMKLNERALTMSEEGRVIYNLSAGQLSVKPPAKFIEKMNHQLNFLKSYQYAPVSGFSPLRKSLLTYWARQRGIDLEQLSTYETLISNGSKHSIYNALGALIDPGDEVIIFSPYWVSYPPMINFWGGIPVVVKTNVFDAFVPALEDLEKIITPRTKLIIINSPNNPSGVHYSTQWMKDFNEFLKKHENLNIICDEVYSDISYFDPIPTYYYQFEPKLLERTIIIQSISKSLAATGLRLGYAFAPENVITAMSRIQGQTTSAASSLVQRALMDFDLADATYLLEPIKGHLRVNASFLREKFREYGLSHCWYQSVSAFYFMLDFSRTPMFEKFNDDQDHSFEISELILNELGISVVPGSDFGLPNSARISLLLEEIPFQEAINRLLKFVANKT